MGVHQRIGRVGQGGDRDIGGCLWVSDVARSMRWYKETLDLHGYPYPSNQPYVYAILTAENRELAFLLMRPEGYQHAIPDAPVDGIQPGVVEIDVDDVEQLHEKLKARVAIHEPLAKGNDERYRFAIEDPDHHVLVFRQMAEEAV